MKIKLLRIKGSVDPLGNIVAIEMPDIIDFQVLGKISNPVSLVLGDGTPNQLDFLRGREYERIDQKDKFTQKGIREACKKIMENFPKYKKPDDGDGDEDSYNAGFNAALDEVSKVFLDSFPKIMY